MERKALGKGISALIPEKNIEEKGQTKNIKLSLIRPNPFQPREYFDNQSIEELAQSIKEKGVIQPVLVRQKGDYYELIAGERRFRAAQLLQLEEIPVIIRDAKDQDALELSLIENIQRQDLNPIEEARAYQYLIEKFGLSQDRLSEIIGKARVSIANILRLLKLPQEIQEEIKKGRISFAHGRTLLEVSDENQQRRLTQEIISKNLSIRELENLIKGRRRRISIPAARPPSLDTYVIVLQDELQQLLSTKVRIIKKKKRGSIIIEFYSSEDLDRIVKRIKGRDA